MRRTAIFVVGSLLLCFFAAIIAVKSIVTREFLVERIEESISSKVEIGKVHVSLLSFPARITLSNVSLSPLSSAEDNDASIQVERVDLRVSLFALLMREVDVKSITVSGADIETTYREEGGHSIESLFEDPEKDTSDPSEPSSLDGESKSFNAFKQKDFVARLGNLTIENSRAHILLENMGVKLFCKNVNVVLSEMKIDPNKLEETDVAQLDVSADVRVDSVKGWQYGELFLRGEAVARIFNSQTGEAEPDVEGDFSLTQDSWLNTRIPFITHAWSTLSILEQVGVQVSGLPERARFGRSEAIAARYHLGKITVRKPLSIWVADWEIAALEKSWLDTGTDEHEAFAELLASESASEGFLSLMRKGVDFLPERVREVVIQNIREKLYRYDRLLVPMKSTGDFSDPDIRPSGEIPDLAESAEEAGKELLKEKAGDLLRGLLNRD